MELQKKRDKSLFTSAPLLPCATAWLAAVWTTSIQTLYQISLI
jgi:hypothetical protein